MTIHNTTVNSREVDKFSQYSAQWWDLEGPLKTLHDINPSRILFMRQVLMTNQSQQDNPFKETTVLDVGCGGGILAEAIAAEGALITGLDVESAAIETARVHALGKHLSINYVCQPIEHFVSEPFDIISSMEMLEHTENPEMVIEHCARLLKPGGYLFLSTINRSLKAYASAIIAAEYLLNILPRQTHDFDKFIKPSELAAMTRAAGLDTVAISGLDYNPITRRASLTQSVAVNYLLACRKPPC